MPSQSKCKICKTTLHDPNATYCQGCAYQKGICHVCGRAESSGCQWFTSAFPGHCQLKPCFMHTYARI